MKNVQNWFHKIYHWNYTVTYPCSIDSTQNEIPKSYYAYRRTILDCFFFCPQASTHTYFVCLTNKAKWWPIVPRSFDGKTKIDDFWLAGAKRFSIVLQHQLLCNGNFQPLIYFTTESDYRYQNISWPQAYTCLTSTKGFPWQSAKTWFISFSISFISQDHLWPKLISLT